MKIIVLSSTIYFEGYDGIKYVYESGVLFDMRGNEIKDIEMYRKAFGPNHHGFDITPHQLREDT